MNARRRYPPGFLIIAWLVFTLWQPFGLLKAFVDDPFQLSVDRAEFIIGPFFNFLENDWVDPKHKGFTLAHTLGI